MYNGWFCILGKVHSECVRMPTPSADDPICRKFFESMSAQTIKLPGRKDSYSIAFWNDTAVCKLIWNDCYYPNISNNS